MTAIRDQSHHQGTIWDHGEVLNNVRITFRVGCGVDVERRQPRDPIATPSGVLYGVRGYLHVTGKGGASEGNDLVLVHDTPVGAAVYLVRLLCQHLSGLRAIFRYQCLDFALCSSACGFFHDSDQLLACFFAVVEKWITRRL